MANKATLATNSVEGRTKPFIDRIETIELEYEAIVKEARETRNADKKEILKDAKESGVEVKPLKAIVRTRKLQRKIAIVPQELNEADAGIYRGLADAFGGPMGEWFGDQAKLLEGYSTSP